MNLAKNILAYFSFTHSHTESLTAFLNLLSSLLSSSDNNRMWGLDYIVLIIDDVASLLGGLNILTLSESTGTSDEGDYRWDSSSWITKETSASFA